MTFRPSPDLEGECVVIVCRSVFVIIALTAGSAVAGPLQDAAESGNVELIQRSLDEGADLSAMSEAGDPALVLAALNGHDKAVSILLKRGADIATRNKGGLTALHAAAYAGNIDIVKQLVTNGADVNDTSNFYKMSPLHAAAEEGHADVVTFLLSSGAKVEAPERNGYTPLTQAGWRGYWGVAETLMRAGASCQNADLVGEALYAECTKRKLP